MSINYRDRISGGTIGLLIGDAVGVPYEFHHPDRLPEIELIAPIPPPDFDRSHADTPPGTWSDDGSQALCLLASLLECDRLDPEDLGDRLVRWWREGYLAVDGRVFDIGVHTRMVLSAIEGGTPALEAGSIGKGSARGNGSLMRVLPLVLWHRGTDAELVAAAHLQSEVTHGDDYCRVCCALYCLWARQILHNRPLPWATAVEILQDIYAPDPYLSWILTDRLRPADPVSGDGSGYVIACLRSARWAIECHDDYASVVKAAISLGRDTDTTACVAGGIAGIQYGIRGIPADWQQILRGRELLAPLLSRLLDRY